MSSINQTHTISALTVTGTISKITRRKSTGRVNTPMLVASLEHTITTTEKSVDGSIQKVSKTITSTMIATGNVYKQVENHFVVGATLKIRAILDTETSLGNHFPGGDNMRVLRILDYNAA